MSPREIEIEKLILAGKTRHDIVNELGIALPTVIAHLRSVHLKRGVANDHDLIFQQCDVIPKAKAAGA